MFKFLDQNFAVSGQIDKAQIEAIAKAGFKTIINNRPDGEVPFQPKSEEFEAHARSLSLNYVHIPISGGVNPEDVEKTYNIIQNSPHPIFAFCGSGMRSSLIWGLAHIADRSLEDILTITRENGYDLSRFEPIFAHRLEQVRKN